MFTSPKIFNHVVTHTPYIHSNANLLATLAHIENVVSKIAQSSNLCGKCVFNKGYNTRLFDNRTTCTFIYNQHFIHVALYLLFWETS